MQTVHVQESLLLHDMHSNYMPQAAEQNHICVHFQVFRVDVDCCKGPAAQGP